MGGPVQDFINTLCKEKGLIKRKVFKNEDGEIVHSFKGRFWKFENCDIAVIEDSKGSVYKVVMATDLDKNSRSINLTNLIESFTIKYGPYKVERESDRSDDIFVWTSDGGMIKYKILYIPDILDALRIDYIDCDMKKIQEEKLKEKIKELNEL